MSNNSNNRPIILTAAGVLAAILAGGGGAFLFNSQPDSVVQEPPAIEAPAQETPAAPETIPGQIATETPETSDIAVAPGGSSGDGVGGPGEGVESIADKEPMILPETADTPSVYWVGADGNQVAFEAEKIALSRDEAPTDSLTTAIETLLDGEESTAIPSGTELLSLKVEGEDVYIDLSGRFTEGGGTSSMAARMGQVIYTTNTVQPDAQIWLSVDGELLDMIGGEGLIVDQPLTEERFARDFNL